MDWTGQTAYSVAVRSVLFSFPLLQIQSHLQEQLKETHQPLVNEDGNNPQCYETVSKPPTCETSLMKSERNQQWTAVNINNFTQQFVLKTTTNQDEAAAIA